MEFVLAGAFTVLVAGTLAYVHQLFADIAPAGPLWAWTLFVAAVVAVMIAVPVIVAVRRPSDDEIVRVWSVVGKAVAVSFDLAVASSVWLLLPYASEPLQLLMVVFYAACVSGQVISTAESTGTIVFGVVSIFGSAAVFFLGQPGPYSAPLAVFLVAFGALMIAVASVLKTAIRSAIRARLGAEAVSAELAEALAAVTEARNSKTRFIAAATHDLRQPLQAAALFFERHVRSDDPAVRARTSDSARLAFEEASGLLDRLLEHLRLDAGAVTPRLEDVPLGPLMERVTAETAPLAAAGGIELRVAAGGLTARCDETMTARILRNYLHNAVRHSRGRRVLVGCRRRGDRVRLYVIDDGRGVPSGDHELVFAEFRQGSATRDRYGGMGLGLASARRSAELMGGSVGLDARWLRGAAFYLELPRACGGEGAPPQT